MNLQQTYYLPLEANRPDLSSTFSDYMEEIYNSGNFMTNVLPEYQHDSAAAPNGASSLSSNETCNWGFIKGHGIHCYIEPSGTATGNLLWALSILARNAAYTNNETLTTSVLCPLLNQSLQFYQHIQIVNKDDNSIHLPATYSPEYPHAVEPDANYDVSLYRWGLEQGIQLSQQYPNSICNGPNVNKWKTTLNTFTWFPIDPITDTLEIYSGVPYAIPHRHYSHLFSIWPLHLLNLSNTSQYNTASNSVNLWLATPEKDSMFYRPAASAMNVLLSKNAAAFDNVTYLLNHRIEGSGWYREGSQGSCTETPYANAWAVINWMVSSWNTTKTGQVIIDFFPGIDDVIHSNLNEYVFAPSRAATAQIYRMGTHGGVLVSGRRKLVTTNTTHFITTTSWIAVEAAANDQSIIVKTNMKRPLSMKSNAMSKVKFVEIGDGSVEIIGLNKDETSVLFSTTDVPDDFTISPLNGCKDNYNHWGLLENQKKKLDGDTVWPCL